MAVVTQAPARTGRAAELGLLFLAVVVVLLAHAESSLTITGAMPEDFALHAAGAAGVALVGHLVVRWRAPYADPVILPAALTLNGLGLVMIQRLSLSHGGGADAPLPARQALWTLVALVAVAAVLWIVRDHRILRRYTYTAMVVGVGLLLLPMVPGLGVEVNGARVWIRAAGMSFQPGEIAKIVLAIFLAGYLVTKRDTLTLAGKKILGLQFPRARDLGPILLAWGASILVLVGQRDLGAALLFFGMFVAMLYVATERLSWILIGMLLFVAGAVAAGRLFTHVRARFDMWLDPFDPEIMDRAVHGSWQTVSGLFGLAGGGLTGAGWGGGYPATVPLAHSDFIVAAFGEELGLVGLLAILMLYLVLIERGLRVAIGVRDDFGKLFASGVSAAMAFQVFVVVGGITTLIPLTGLTAPFLAQGGSSLVSSWILVALLLRISDSARRPAPRAEPIIDVTGELEPTPSAEGDDDRPTEVVRP
ncbi:FtsW/RodA/SpoVE family cell cycle protein [Bogoriella caseilytica]|uniref:Cell elongation-specific peptidoglycan biosynthesis regulator RodA n=1 Tax=Bogoriella caseilytica TaxID=56055 RepID=A0A3N2BCC5_9MICO|nr:FtsW/RodA/SpoVE family cell cycle protein [Bogoriella caseilytica]ROR72911.1 cell elongation-specific peptidoglycan biosynthesis regulator RodA [Bogoriella caseilytica]